MELHLQTITAQAVCFFSNGGLNWESINASFIQEGSTGRFLCTVCCLQLQLMYNTQAVCFFNNRSLNRESINASFIQEGPSGRFLCTVCCLQLQFMLAEHCPNCQHCPKCHYMKQLKHRYCHCRPLVVTFIMNSVAH